MLSDEHRIVFVYYVRDTPEDWDGTTAKMVGPDTEDGAVVLVTIYGYQAMYFGAPNDEAFEGHPLESRELHPYGSFEIKPSSWIARLDEMNSVHHCHTPGSFEGMRHIVLAFHDSLFECVVCGKMNVETRAGSIHSAFGRMSEILSETW